MLVSSLVGARNVECTQRAILTQPMGLLSLLPRSVLAAMIALLGTSSWGTRRASCHISPQKSCTTHATYLDRRVGRVAPGSNDLSN